FRDRLKEWFIVDGEGHLAHTLIKGTNHKDVANRHKTLGNKLQDSSHQISQECGNACERCGHKFLTECVCLELHQTNAPDDSRDRLVVLCVTCRALLNWARSVCNPEREAEVILDWSRTFRLAAQQRVGPFLEQQANERMNGNSS